MAKEKSWWWEEAEDSGTWFGSRPPHLSPGGQSTVANQSRGAEPQGLKFHTHLSTSIAQQESRERKGKPGGSYFLTSVGSHGQHLGDRQ